MQEIDWTFYISIEIKTKFKQKKREKINKQWRWFACESFDLKKNLQVGLDLQKKKTCFYTSGS